MTIILVTNDDGVHSPGLAALYHTLGEAANVYVVAPDRERSASGHSLTLDKPLKIERLADKVFSVSGTPTDCVAIGVEKLLPERPSIVVSGINNGPNLGDDITYSGTVSAAMEGTIMNIPSVAVSLAVRHGETPMYYTAAEIAKKAVQYIIEHSLPYDTLLNINVPNIEHDKIAGMKITRQGKRVYSGAIKETYSPWGELYYWIGGGTPHWERGEDTDMNAITQGYVSITPIHLDFTNTGAMDLIKNTWKI